MVRTRHADFLFISTASHAGEAPAKHCLSVPCIGEAASAQVLQTSTSPRNVGRAMAATCFLGTNHVDSWWPLSADAVLPRWNESSPSSGSGSSNVSTTFSRLVTMAGGAAAAGAQEQAPEAAGEAHGTGHIRGKDIALIVSFTAVSAAVGGIMYAMLKPGKPPPKRGSGSDGQSLRTPTLEVARAMPSTFSEYSNDLLIVLADGGNHAACAERLAREVMRIDRCDYSQAQKVVEKIAKKTQNLMTTATLPFAMGMGMAITAGVASVPLVFNRTTVEWFNRNFVQSDVPEPKDMETMWEVAGWSWGWMEPLLGTASFVILCMQLVQQMMSDIDMLAYHQRVKVRVANVVAKNYSQYHRDLVRSFVLTSSMHSEPLLDD
mmetsp:Transcript_33389/g.61253  ORF Transcript_33389/g.61253 Transcript_33389/m.61253 type:complete len:377 (-) Transcript_33389:131-1261(-)